MRKRYYFILVLVLCVFLYHPAFAAKCVKPNGNGGCYDNIQDAIDAVAPGGTVKVYPGIYHGPFNANKPGITIAGMGNKRTDVRVNLQGSGYNGISAANVTIKNLTSQNSNDGFYIQSTGNNSRILNVNIFTVVNFIVIHGADDILIKNCKLSRSAASGVLGDGERITVQNTSISNCGINGIDCSGDQLTVEGCTIRDSGLDLIHVEASNATIRDNQLFDADRHGIYAISNFVKVTENLVKGTEFYGIYIEGESPVVKKNTVMYAQNTGFNINVTAGDSKVVNNLSSYNDTGFVIDVAILSSTNLIKKNKALKNSGSGIALINTGDKMIIENQSRDNGSNGISVTENGFLKNNIVSGNGLYGYQLDSNNEAIQNKALNNTWTGFYINGDHNLLQYNRSIGNVSDGIRLTGSANNNNIFNNTALDNICDKYDEGFGNLWTGTVYDTECPR